MVFLNGAEFHTPDPVGRAVTDDHFLMLFNAHSDDVDFVVPKDVPDASWSIALRTSPVTEEEAAQPPTFAPGESLSLPARSMLVLQSPLG